MKKLLLIFLLLPFLSYAQRGATVAITTHTRTGQVVEGEEQVYDFYVDQAAGSDANPGSNLQPFATAQAAAAVAVAGDRVGFRTGTYRETITPANSGTAVNPIIFEGIHGETVTISGANDAGATGWTVDAGNIYRKTITLPVASNFTDNIGGSNTVLMANQVFKDGVMQILARWPNAATPEDLLDKTKMRPLSSVSSWGDVSVTDAGLPLAAPGLNGAYISMNGWFITQTRQITNHSGNTLSYGTVISVNGAQFRKFYYVTNKRALLDAAKEWHYEAGVLYFWQNGGGSPTGVEYKARNWGFDLRGKDYITIHNIDFFACDPVHGDAAGTNVTIDNIRALYTNHGFIQSNAGGAYYATAKQCGIKLLGANSVIKNSEIRYAGSHGVWLGPGCRAENNYFYNTIWDGMWGAPMKPWGNDDNQVMTRNTSVRSGRGAVELHDNGIATLNMDISYNDFSGHNMLSIDGGAVYTGIQADLTGTRVHHNWFHDAGVNYAEGVNGVQVTGVYIDQGAGPIIIDHNVTWDPSNPQPIDYYAEIANPWRDNGGSKLYNNTFIGTDRNYITYATPVVTDVQRNNIYRGDISSPNTAPNVAFSLAKTVNPLFVGTGTGGLVYRIQLGSPAINTGTNLGAPFNIGIVGATDIGAYEYGGEDWVPGYVEVIEEPPVGGAGDIVSLGSVSPITVVFNTAFGSIGLPGSVSAVFTGSVAGAVNLTWALGTYNPVGNPYADTPYTLIGTPVLEPGVTNSGNITVSCVVTMSDMFQPLTQTIAGIYDFTKLVTNTTNVYGTVNSAGDITLVKSLAPGPLSRDYVVQGTAPKFSAGSAVLIGTGSFQQSTVNTDLDFEHYASPASDLKYTEIIALKVNDTGGLNGIIGNNGYYFGNNGVSLLLQTATTQQDLVWYIGGFGSDALVNVAAGGLIPGANTVLSIQVDNALAAASKVKTYRNLTLVSATATGTGTFSNVLGHGLYNMGDAGTNGVNDMSGNIMFRVVLQGTESDAVRNKLIQDIAAYCNITL